MAFVQRTDVGTDIPNIVETGREILKGAGTNLVSIYTSIQKGTPKQINRKKFPLWITRKTVKVLTTAP